MECWYVLNFPKSLRIWPSLIRISIFSLLFIFQRIAMKFEGGRVAEPERAGKVPSDIHISRVEKGASAEVTKADANVGGF